MQTIVSRITFLDDERNELTAAIEDDAIVLSMPDTFWIVDDAGVDSISSKLKEMIKELP